MQEIKLPHKPIYLHPPACAVMIFLFIQTCYLKIKLFLLSTNPLSFNFSVLAAERKKGKACSVHAVREKHITHKHAIWTTNDSHHGGHQSGCYCSGVLINLDQESWVLCRQFEKLNPVTTHARGRDPRDSLKQFTLNYHISQPQTAQCLASRQRQN